MPGFALIEEEVCVKAAPTRRLHPGLVRFAIAAWLLLHCWRGLLIYFSNDDIMNMYWAREISLGRLMLSVLVPFTTVYRPTGSLFYRCLYAVFGLHPLPFRIVFYELLLLSLMLLYKLVLALTGKRAAAALAAFVASFHGHYSDLYLNNGTIYDVLCACFYLGALYYYVSIRSQDRYLRPSELAVLYLLATAALNAKEMAATLPAVLLLFELTRPWRQWSRRSHRSRC
jgi:hypothetical protein